MRFLVAAIFVLMSSQAMAGDVDEEKLGQIIAGSMLTKSCTQYKVDPVAAGAHFYIAGIRDGDLSPGGQYHAFMVDSVSNFASTQVAILRMGKTESELRAMNCDFAKRYYGPDGSILKGLLVER